MSLFDQKWDFKAFWGWSLPGCEMQPRPSFLFLPTDVRIWRDVHWHSHLVYSGSRGDSKTDSLTCSPDQEINAAFGAQIPNQSSTGRPAPENLSLFPDAPLKLPVLALSPWLDFRRSCGGQEGPKGCYKTANSCQGLYSGRSRRHLRNWTPRNYSFRRFPSFSILASTNMMLEGKRSQPWAFSFGCTASQGKDLGPPSPQTTHPRVANFEASRHSTSETIENSVDRSLVVGCFAVSMTLTVSGEEDYWHFGVFTA